MPDVTAQSARGLYGISVTSELSGIAPQTLRLYERRRLLTPSRTDGGTRRYSDHDLVRLQRITELVNAGVNLAGRSQGGPRRTKGGLPLMTDVENTELPDDAPEADAMEQNLAVDADDETGLDATRVEALRDRDATEADVIDQAIVVPLPAEEDPGAT